LCQTYAGAHVVRERHFASKALTKASSAFCVAAGDVTVATTGADASTRARSRFESRSAAHR
jgi:hypothetical protein